MSFEGVGPLIVKWVIYYNNYCEIAAIASQPSQTHVSRTQELNICIKLLLLGKPFKKNCESSEYGPIGGRGVVLV